MEKELVLKWLSSNGYGDGNGSGDGNGNGDGYGYGDGNGDGYGNGNGNGYGDGYGNGDGSGDGEKIIKHKGYNVFYIDNMPTIITAIFGNYAKGFTIGEDYQLTPCYVAKSEIGNFFAHGETLEKAMEDLQEKIADNMSDEEKIQMFCTTFKKDEKYKGTEFFKWHSILTGSCLFGRNEFVKNHNLDVEALYTVNEFITICENDYGKDIIKELKKYY